MLSYYCFKFVIFPPACEGRWFFLFFFSKNKLFIYIYKEKKKYTMKEEIWKPIEGYGDYYAVSTWGRVKSLPRAIIQKNGVIHHRREKILKSQPNKKNGLLQIMLIVHGRYKLFYVHRLVAQTFVSNPYDYNVVIHLNGNQQDNRADNLQWLKAKRPNNIKSKLNYNK